MESGKLQRIMNEVFRGEVDTGRFRALLDGGWKIAHTPGTAFVDLRHPAGGQLSLLEVKTYGTDFTAGEADEIARFVSELLRDHFESPCSP